MAAPESSIMQEHIIPVWDGLSPWESTQAEDRRLDCAQPHWKDVRSSHRIYDMNINPNNSISASIRSEHNAHQIDVNSDYNSHIPLTNPLLKAMRPSDDSNTLDAACYAPSERTQGPAKGYSAFECPLPDDIYVEPAHDGDGEPLIDAWGRNTAVVRRYNRYKMKAQTGCPILQKKTQPYIEEAHAPVSLHPNVPRMGKIPPTQTMPSLNTTSKTLEQKDTPSITTTFQSNPIFSRQNITKIGIIAIAGLATLLIAKTFRKVKSS